MSINEWGNDTFINVGRDYPDTSRFVIVIWDDGPPAVASDVDEPFVCQTGDVTSYRGVPQIEVHDSSDVSVIEYDDYVDVMNEQDGPQGPFQ